ncbi:DUF1853 family protein [Halomonas mongoliensis]|uniref:DUF1853 family protein n=1 Tax=Halomonas mongoliensis TaxID=321265 RepID=A0ABU1GMS9_9GAMM|nr:DUF1853 family protein [Halomonas mongoliensis]MDR5893303.1 DUF1853 family protein [Halomonas mongoliensis]
MPTAPLPLLDRCHHPLVRDLAWLLLAPDLVAMPWPGRPSRAALGLGDDGHLAAWLDDLEAWPEALEERVGDTLQGRMGLYHERLWQFLLDSAPGTELLAHNLRILRGKQTLGELDLLYRHPGQSEVTHLEVAIKYYLGLTEGPGAPDDQARWIGPGGADSLAGKREHLHRHQLRLTELPETRDALQALLGRCAAGADGARPVTRRLAMPGVLFYPWHARLPPPREAHPAHLRGHWLHWQAWRRYRHGLGTNTRGARLAKPHWLALPRPERLLPLGELEAQLAEHFREPASPVQLALWHAEMGWRRLFVVADDWPRQVPLPPRAAPGAADPDHSP